MRTKFHFLPYQPSPPAFVIWTGRQYRQGNWYPSMQEEKYGELRNREYYSRTTGSTPWKPGKEAKVWKDTRSYELYY